MATNPTQKLTPKQQDAIVALLNEHNVAKAAASVNVGPRTLYRWLDEPAFSKAYRKARRDAFGQAIALLQRYSSLAANTLAKVTADASTPPNARVSASSAILRFGREGIELEDLAARIDALEQAADKDAKS